MANPTVSSRPLDAPAASARTASAGPSAGMAGVERIDLPNGWYFEQVNHGGTLFALRTPSGAGFGMSERGVLLHRSHAESFAAAFAPAAPTAERSIEIDYTKGDGEPGIRTIVPTGRLLPGDDVHHPGARWVIEAFDPEQNAMRTFDPAHLHRWGDQVPRSSFRVLRASLAAVKDALPNLAPPAASPIPSDMGEVERMIGAFGKTALKLGAGLAENDDYNAARTALIEAIRVLESRAEAPRPRLQQTAAVRDVISERFRQVEEEGRTAGDDDHYVDGDMAKAAACYASPVRTFQEATVIGRGREPFAGFADLWPWAGARWKPGDRRRDLVKAGALILAEIERLDRAAEAAETAASPNAGDGPPGAED